MIAFNKCSEKKDQRVFERNQEFQKKIRRQLYAVASSNRKLSREPIMKKTIKRHTRRNPKYQGVAQLNYDML